MSHSVINPVFTGLIKQLVYFDENSTLMLDKYYPKFDPDRKEIETLMGNYRDRLEHIVRNFKSDILASTVLIGSQVTVLNELDDQYEAYTIVFPEYSDMDQLFISCYSPMGRQLLLSRIGETITVFTPAGSIALTITKIEFLVYEN